MNEIKFRAFDAATKKHWVPKPKGVIYFDIMNVPDFIANTHNENGEWQRRFTVEQFTGIKDSNGVDIYEGDIVHIDYVEYRPSPFNIECFTGVVKFIDGSFMVEKNSDIGDFLFQEIALVSVLGNIHQNQELIGVR